MIEFFNKSPGSLVSPSVEDPTMQLVEAEPSVPEVVRLPQELGGGVRRVEGNFVGPCVCGDGHKVRHLVLGDISVAECTTQFMWYRTPR
jgi:hypothetical protein